MAQSSTSSPDACAAENAGAMNPENVDSPNRMSSDAERERPGERLLVLSQELSAAERNLAAQGDTQGAQRIEEQLSTRELLLDELIEQLGSWENEIARRRDDLDRQQRRLDSRQGELDRRDKELTEEREQLQKKQIEAERTAAAAEAKLAVFSQLEGALRSRDNVPQASRRALEGPSVRETGRTAPPAPGSADAAAPVMTTTESSRDIRSVLSSSPTGNKVGPPSAPGADPSTMPASTPESGSDPELGAGAAAGGLATARFWNQMSGTANPGPASATPPEATPVRPSDSESGATSISNSKSDAATERETHDEEETDPAIQDYMTALLGRGENKRQLRAQPDRPAPSRAPARGESPGAETISEKSSPASTAVQPRPARKPTPKVDLTAHMPALRDMANESARSALHHYSRQRIAEWLQWVVVAVLATLMIGMAVFWFSKPLAVLAVGAAVVVACGALLMVNKHAANRFDADRGGQRESRQARSEAEDDELDADSKGD